MWQCISEAKRQKPNVTLHKDNPCIRLCSSLTQSNSPCKSCISSGGFLSFLPGSPLAIFEFINKPTPFSAQPSRISTTAYLSMLLRSCSLVWSWSSCCRPQTGSYCPLLATDCTDHNPETLLSMVLIPGQGMRPYQQTLVCVVKCALWLVSSVWKLPSSPSATQNDPKRRRKTGRRAALCFCSGNKLIRLKCILDVLLAFDSKQLSPASWNSEQGALFLYLKPTLTGVLIMCMCERESQSM